VFSSRSLSITHRALPEVREEIPPGKDVYVPDLSRGVFEAHQYAMLEKGFIFDAVQIVIAVWI